MANDNMVILLIAGGAALIGATFLLKPGGARADVGTGVRIDGTGGLTPQEQFNLDQQIQLQKELEEKRKAEEARGETPRARIKIAVGSEKGPSLHRDWGIRVTR